MAQRATADQQLLLAQANEIRSGGGVAKATGPRRVRLFPNDEGRSRAPGILVVLKSSNGKRAQDTAHDQLLMTAQEKLKLPKPARRLFLIPRSLAWRVWAFMS